MTKVYWTPDTNNYPEFEVIFPEPESLYKHLLKTRSGSDHIKCPAFVDFVKNTYVIKSAIDMELLLNRKDGSMQVVSGISEGLATYIINRSDQVGEGCPMLMSLPPAYIFYSKDDVVMESLHGFMELNNSVSNIMSVPGTFNISKWIRSIDFTVEVKNENIPVKIKKDDVLFYVRFKTKDDSKVELERVPLTDELKYAVKACFSVKNHVKNLPLKTLYKMAEPFLSLLSFKKPKPKTCPFGFGKK
jgi:hypothetical protein